MKLIMENWRKHLEERIADQTIPQDTRGSSTSSKVNYSELINSIRGIRGSDIWWQWVNFLRESYCSTQDNPSECRTRLKSYTSRKEIEEFFKEK